MPATISFRRDIIDPALYGQMFLFFVPVWIQRMLAYPLDYIAPRIANMIRAMTLKTSGKISQNGRLWKILVKQRLR
ncbi:unnamed protein product [Strongylus vulgaris]|uniref:Uncharacterized protein n=1 Tax=Strongylus vulgaris TaxID=40348 RepID=A0A3P7JRB8_STRVU|nr:unnamed protein product [Strongylus vulgaris]